MEGEKSEWLSHVHVASADGDGRLPAHARARSRRPRPPGRRTGSGSRSSPAARPDKDRQGQCLAHPRGRRRGGGAHRREGRRQRAPRWSPDGKHARVPDGRPRRPTRRRRRTRRSATARVVDEERQADAPLRGAGREGRGGQAARCAALTRRRDEPRQRGGPRRLRLVARRPQIVFAHQPTPLIDDWPRRTSRWSTWRRARCARWPPPPAAESRSGLLARRHAQVAFDESDDPPTWRGRSRVAVVPGRGRHAAPAGRDLRTHSPTCSGWTADGRARLRRDAPHREPRWARCPWTAGRRRGAEPRTT